MDLAVLLEEFIEAAREFVKLSDRLNDGWKLFENSADLPRSYIKKETFITIDDGAAGILKAEYVIFYNLSYRVPAFSFNIWNSSGVLLKLEDIRRMSYIKINEKDFYSAITQQEHPLFCRPYFIMHPCYTETILSAFKGQSRNIVLTFLSHITPLLNLNLPLEYGLC